MTAREKHPARGRGTSHRQFSIADFCQRRLVAPLGRWLEEGLLGTTLFILVVSETLSVLAIWNFGEFWVDRTADAFHVDVQQMLALPDEAQGRVVTVLIGDSAYENDFSQTSPLDRRIVAGLMRNLARENARATLVVDLDLSPRGDAEAAADQGILDDELRKLGRRLVLMTPDRVASPAVAERKLEWMRQLCDAGVRFGSPIISVRYGAADPRFPAQGTLAGAALEPPGAVADQCVLARSIARGLAPVFWLKAGYTPDETAALQPTATLRPEYFVSGRTQTLDAVEQIRGMPALRQADHVVLGGGWGPDDKYVTASGEHYGAEVHAARLHSLIHPARELPFLWTALLGVLVVGAVALRVAEWPLREHFHHFEAYKGSLQRKPPPGCCTEDAGRYFLFSAFWLVAFLVIVGVFILCFFLLNSLAVHLFAYRLGVANLIFAFVTGLFVLAPRIYRNVCFAGAVPAVRGEGKPAADGVGQCKAIWERVSCALHVHATSCMQGGGPTRGGLALVKRLANLVGVALSLGFIAWSGWILLRDFV